MSYLQRDLVSHTRRVCSLYKLMLRNVDFCEPDLLEGRFTKLKIRAEFDKYKNLKDLRKAAAILQDAESDFKQNQHPIPASGVPYHPFSKEGIAYERELESPDYVMDWYHPLEKAQYPYYFAKREAMKEEYIKLWRKKMMKPGDAPEDKPERT